VLVVRLVGAIDFCSAMASKEGLESLIEQGCVIRTCHQLSRSGQQRFVDGGADTDSRHAMIMP